MNIDTKRIEYKLLEGLSKFCNAKVQSYIDRDRVINRIYVYDYNINYDYYFIVNNNHQFLSQEQIPSDYKADVHIDYMISEIEKKIFSDIYKHFMKDENNEIVKYFCHRTNIDYSFLRRAFTNLELILVDPQSSCEIFKYNGLYDRYYFYNNYDDEGRFNLFGFTYSNMNMKRRYTTSVRKPEDLFVAIIKDFLFIMNDIKGKGKAYKFLDSIYMLSTIDSNIMNQIELYNAY